MLLANLGKNLFRGASSLLRKGKIANITRRGIGGLKRGITNVGSTLKRKLPLRNRFNFNKYAPGTSKLKSFKRRAGNISSSLKRKGRRAAKGAWRKTEFDPLSTGVSAYAASRPTDLRVQYDSTNSPNLASAIFNSGSFGSW